MHTPLSRSQLGTILSDITLACAIVFIICSGLELWQKGIVGSYVNMQALLIATLAAGVSAVLITPRHTRATDLTSSTHHTPTPMTDCIFCKIAHKELPAHTVFEDDATLAFLDIRPTTKGHTLVIAKEHTPNFLETDSALLSTIQATVQKIAPAVLKAVGSEGFNININNGAVAGQIIFHLHWHIVPRFADDGLRLWPGREYQEGEADKLAEAIRAHL